jgi:hypothetical protein
MEMFSQCRSTTHDEPTNMQEVIIKCLQGATKHAGRRGKTVSKLSSREGIFPSHFAVRRYLRFEILPSGRNIFPWQESPRKNSFRRKPLLLAHKFLRKMSIFKRFFSLFVACIPFVHVSWCYPPLPVRHFWCQCHTESCLSWEF